MNPVLKGVLGTAGVYVGSLVLYGVWLVVGLLIAGKGRGTRVAVGLFGTQALGTLTFLVGIYVVYRLLGSAGASQGLRVGVSLAYALLALGTLAVLILLTFLSFNR